MLINKNTKIFGKRVILVPYKKEHVPKYHKWMQSPELQDLTASEPLTLSQEYEMQESWMVDKNKCTFIVLDRETFESTNNEEDAMIGDTNLFFSNDDSTLVAEAEIMIAEPSARGNKRGWEAMILMLLYGIMHLEVRQFIVKIGLSNMTSISMFTKMGFVKTSESNVFQEATFCKIVDNVWISWLKEKVGMYEIINTLDPF